jgi:hypothetical protein
MHLTVIIVLIVIILSVIFALFPQTIFGSRQNILQHNPTEYRPKWLVESSIYLSDNSVNSLSEISLAPKIHKDGIERWKIFVDKLPPIETFRRLNSDENVHINNLNVTHLSVFVTLKSPALIRVKKIYYPHWSLKDISGKRIELHPDTQTGLIHFYLPSGNHKLTLRRQLLSSEQIGVIISILSCIVIILWITIINNDKFILFKKKEKK